MSKFFNKKCVPCEDKDKDRLLSIETAKEYLSELKDWKMNLNNLSIYKELEFKDFVKAMAFVDSVADVAEVAGHHPDINIRYNRVRLELSTHSLGGLTDNDFIVASQIDGLWIV